MTKIATPLFDFESKKDYMKPTLKVVEIKHRFQILAGSVDANGMNNNLVDEEVIVGW